MTALPPVTQIILLLIVLPAAVFDVRFRKIPNWLAIAGAILGISLNTFLYGSAGLRMGALGLLVAFGVYFMLYALRAMGAGDVKLMGAVGALVGPANWFGIFVISAVLGGIMALILVLSKGRLQRTLFNVGFILSEMKSGRPAYLGKEELDVKNPKALGLPHGAVIAVGCVFFMALSAHFAG